MQKEEENKQLKNKIEKMEEDKKELELKCNNMDIKIGEYIKEIEEKNKKYNDDIQFWKKKHKEEEEKSKEEIKQNKEIIKKYEKQIKDLEEKNNNLNNQNRNNSINDSYDRKKYSYQCLTSKLRIFIYQGDDQATIPIILKNDSVNKWPDNKTFLLFDKQNSQCLSDNIQLKSLEYNGQSNYDIQFKNLKDLEPNEYKNYFNFNVDGKNYGDKLCLTIIIKPRKGPDLKKQVGEFRKKYNLKTDLFTDEQIFKKLLENKGDFESTFFGLYFS